MNTARIIKHLIVVVTASLVLTTGCIPYKPQPVDSNYYRGDMTFTAANEVPPPDTKPQFYTPAETKILPAPPETVAEKAQAPAPKLTPPPVKEPKPVVSYRQTAQRIHIVQRGETLWRITQIYYGRANSDLVSQIVAANSEISNPNLIYPGQEIIIP